MIRQKAPKDMTATEFVAHLEIVASREMLTKNLEGWAITLQGLRKELLEPAPNPFTPDQLAWMRVEQEDNGFKYAAMNEPGIVSFFRDKPTRNINYWGTAYGSAKRSSTSFLVRMFSENDEEPFCFADYAPLEQ